MSESVEPTTGSVSIAPKRLLELDNVTLRFGGVTALDSVSFHINEGEILGLIGPNGAGKTTAFNAMTGVYRPTSGRVLFDGKPLGRLKRFQITKLGISRTFQNIRLFPEMTALENVMVGADARHKTSVVGALLRLPRHRREEAEGRARGLELLDFVGIGDRAHSTARNLPYGYQRRLEIARALATEPKLLCLDEPAAGFNPAEKANLLQLIRKIRDRGYTVLLIEHDMRLVMGVTERIVVLEFGRKIAEGLPAEVRDNPAVIAAYLGSPPMLLEIENMSVHYGRIQALHSISLQVEEGEIVTLIGANGAGKTTTMKAVSGLRMPSAGRVRFDGKDITHLRADLRVILGISQAPEGRGIFPGMSVMENLEMGTYARKDPGGVQKKEDLARVFGLFPRLDERKTQMGGTLSGGEQQMLAIGRALMARPRLVLLDEPSMGLAPMLIRQIFDIIKEINEQGTTVLLVEQNAQQALSRADRAYVMETGSITKEGPGEQLLVDPAVKAAYLGVA